jgi:hypothetical protein
VVGARFKINFCVGGAGDEGIVVASHDVVMAILTLFLEAELEDKVVLSNEALEVACVQLRDVS